MRRELGDEPAGEGHSLLKQRLMVGGRICSWWRDERPEVERGQGSLA